MTHYFTGGQTDPIYPFSPRSTPFYLLVLFCCSASICAFLAFPCVLMFFCRTPAVSPTSTAWPEFCWRSHDRGLIRVRSRSGGPFYFSSSFFRCGLFPVLLLLCLRGYNDSPSVSVSFSNLFYRAPTPGSDKSKLRFIYIQYMCTCPWRPPDGWNDLHHHLSIYLRQQRGSRTQQ